MTKSITGNKGEWSEMYVLFRLLSDGRLYAADEQLEKIKGMYFPVLEIIREEVRTKKYEYRINEQISKIQIYLNNQLIDEIDKLIFSNQADYLFSEISKGTNRAFSIDKTEKFMKSIGCSKLAAPSSNKTDITMKIHDIQTGYTPICGFSIKSEVGNLPTLINASGATNFIFEVKGLDREQIQYINSIVTNTKIKDRMSLIFSQADSVKFVKVNSDCFSRNLMLIDSRLTELIAYSLIYHYKDGISTCKEVIKKMELDNPMKYPNNGFYEYKFKKFLCSAALGMTPARKWDGIDEANGGYIIVTAKGDVLAYHIYNRAFFEEYLLNNTKFDRGSTSRHGFASLYNEDDKIFMKLNLQIRFK